MIVYALRFTPQQFDETRMIHAAIGFRVKSGWATAVLLAGPIKSPRVLDRRTVDLCDPNIPESPQPFHSALGVLDCLVIVERKIYNVAATRLRQPENELKSSIAEFGRALGGTWRSDEKTATLAAWLALASRAH